ncbi:MAG: hypothetical protein AAGG55_07740 [Pseudomonadota bacterium]
MSENSAKGMNVAGIAATIIVAGYLGLELYGLHNAKERMEPVAVFIEYAGLRHGAALCTEDPSNRNDFERNFDAVTRLATGDLLKRNPDRSEADVVRELEVKREARESEVGTVIAEQGCGSKEAFRLLKLYEARSRLKLRY